LKELREVMRFRFPERKEIEAYIVELDDGRVVVREKQELEKLKEKKESERKEAK